MLPWRNPCAGPCAARRRRCIAQVDAIRYIFAALDTPEIVEPDLRALAPEILAPAPPCSPVRAPRAPVVPCAPRLRARAPARACGR